MSFEKIEKTAGNDEWKKLILSILLETGGNIMVTAALLGVHKSTIRKHVRAMRLWPAVNKIRSDAVDNQ